MSAPRRQKLTEAELHSALKKLSAWHVVEGKLHRSFTFDDFVQAFGFMTRLALVAEKIDHHPDWTNVYNKVEVSLVTHSAGALTELDIAFAEACDDQFRRA